MVEQERTRHKPEEECDRSQRQRSKSQRPAYDQLKAYDESRIPSLDCSNSSLDSYTKFLAENYFDSLPADLVIQLQQSYGNGYVQKVIELIQAEKDSGHSMEPQTRLDMETAFGHDFGDVRIHTNTAADILAKELGAEAFSTGKDIFFRKESYQPGSIFGKGLLGHELTHIVQRSNPSVSEVRKITDPSDTVEREAQAASAALTSGNSPGPSCHQGNIGVITRQKTSKTKTEETALSEKEKPELESLIIEEKEIKELISYIKEEVKHYEETNAKEDKHDIAYQISETIEKYFNLIDKRAIDEKAIQYYKKEAKGLILKNLGTESIEGLMRIVGDEEAYTAAIRRYLGVSRIWQKEMPGKWWEDPASRKILLYILKREKVITRKEMEEERKRITKLKTEISPELELYIHSGAVVIFAIWMLENWEKLKKNKGAKLLFFKENELVEGELPWVYFSRMYEYYYIKKWDELETTCRGFGGKATVLEKDPECQAIYNPWWDVQENAAILPWEDHAKLIKNWEQYFKK